jgi:hypothetical protein
VGIAMLVALALAMGLGAQRFVEAARVAARGVTDPRHYIVAVLGPAALGMPAADEHAGAPTDQPLARAAEDQP